MNYFIVSGLSGSGKSIALQALEDLGYYCIDNLPATLLPELAKKLLEVPQQEIGNCAVGIDSRNRGFLEALPDTLEEIKNLGLNIKILFLQADEPILLTRYSETRRKHPLTDSQTALIEGIRREQELLLPLHLAAARHIDTSHTTPQELRAMVRDFAGAGSDTALTLLFESFGYKHGPPLDADFVFDVRCVANPYWYDELRSLNGAHPQVIEFFEEKEEVTRMIEHIKSFMENWLPSFQEENRSYITVAIGCTGGQHRSVYIANRLAEHFQGHKLTVQVRHRELSGL